MTARRTKFRSVFILAFVCSLLIPLAGCPGIFVPTGPFKHKSLYVTMSDNTKIAIETWVPSNSDPSKKYPTVMNITRYWKAIGAVKNNPVGVTNDDDSNQLAYKFVDQGYAYVTMDVRGTGASFGVSKGPWDEDEVADYHQVVNWIVSQSWSNGNVGAIGISYEGNTSALLSAIEHSAVKAVVPRFFDFDSWDIAFPGGTFNYGFIETWSDSNDVLDSGDICGVAEVAGDDCVQVKRVYYGPRAADSDTDLSQLNAAIDQHADNICLKDVLQQVKYLDDPFADTGILMSDSNLYRYKSAIESGGAAWFSWGSWLDAAEDALQSYMTFDNSQQVVIGAWNHGGDIDADPFNAADAPVTPTVEKQYEDIFAFFDSHLKAETTPVKKREIRYTTLNEGLWRTTETWPIENLDSQDWYFTPDGKLTGDEPAEQTGSIDYTVDFSATTGTTNRYFTQMGGGDVIYPDRSEADARLLTYTSDPLPENMRVTGDPVVTLYASSTATDGNFIVYLEDVDETGRVTYVTEGVLRAIHRKVSPEDPPFPIPGPYHTYKRADAAALVPGEVVKIPIKMQPVSVLFRAGHSIRVTVAGADADTFNRVPEDETPTITVESNSIYPSAIMLPVAVD